MSDVGYIGWTCPYAFNGLRSDDVKARLRRLANGINAASDDSRFVQGFIDQGVSMTQMEKLDAQGGSVIAPQEGEDG